MIAEAYRFVRLDQMPEYRQYKTMGDRGVDDPRKSPQHLTALRPEDIK
ncbi:MAG: hypothetical protein WCI21_08820 [Alphaproteobacteria bacterium]